MKLLTYLLSPDSEANKYFGAGWVLVAYIVIMLPIVVGVY